jgi:phenylalanyl-tRNA synthetase alpha chain
MPSRGLTALPYANQEETMLISDDAYRGALALPDLTDAAHGPHALQLLVQEAVAALRDAWACEVIVHRAHPVVSIADNYERLGYPRDAAARDARYTRYVSKDAVLRTHTSAMIPGLLRSLSGASYDDVLLVCPGLVYRRDRVDRISVGEPHQLDLWRLCRAPTGTDDLRAMIDLVVGALVPGADYRGLRAVHPYTREGLEVEVRDGDRWVELLECGLAAPEVLREAGLPRTYAGLAMGVGLDRALMLRKSIDDIRLLRSSDPRVAVQLRDLEPYRPVSSQPPVRRDLSIAVAADTSPEELGDKVRAALGDRADAVEAVEVVDETDGEVLPAQAAERLGLQPGQKNVLLRVVLRHATRTLIDEEANRLRDEVYAAVHEGTEWTWAGGEGRRKDIAIHRVAGRPPDT